MTGYQQGSGGDHVPFRSVLAKTAFRILEQEYQEALATNKIVVFVKDNDKEKMISFSVDVDRE